MIDPDRRVQAQKIVEGLGDLTLGYERALLRGTSRAGRGRNVDKPKHFYRIHFENERACGMIEIKGRSYIEIYARRQEGSGSLISVVEDADTAIAGVRLLCGLHGPRGDVTWPRLDAFLTGVEKALGNVAVR